ncbi:MAG: PolC-type DNA polymerase III [Oscillospiraceae bacterium]|jgi:DNA polymerase III alpha subunit (gram-positive type)|nr:PolC-type DNA polymerase III [Oscillospiraceae bacterium]
MKTIKDLLEQYLDRTECSHTALKTIPESIIVDHLRKEICVTAEFFNENEGCFNKDFVEKNLDFNSKIEDYALKIKLISQKRNCEKESVSLPEKEEHKNNIKKSIIQEYKEKIRTGFYKNKDVKNIQEEICNNLLHPLEYRSNFNDEYCNINKKNAIDKSHKNSKNKEVCSKFETVEIREGNLLYPKATIVSRTPLYGKGYLEKSLIKLENISNNTGRSSIWGEIFSLNIHITKDQRYKIFSINITDYTNSISVKILCNVHENNSLETLKEGDVIFVGGEIKYDNFSREVVMKAKVILRGTKVKTVDNEKEKRIELHLHTNMSAMDGMNSAKDLITRAYEWGHEAIAITDHGVLQAYPEAMNTVEKIQNHGGKFKIIYGVESYFVNDEEKNKDYKNLNSYHQIILVKNKIGLKNLYRLTSMAHIDYFYKRPRILKSDLSQNREGLLLGSACEAGELVRSIMKGVSHDELCKIASFYDFLEIQPIGNNAFMLRDGTFKSEEDLKNLNRKIVALGEELSKPVVATGDVHFLDPHGSEYRKILMACQGFSDAEFQAPLYLKTTKEMLREFSYLGEEKAFEVVVKNPKAISDEISEDIRPIPVGMYPPSIEGADKILEKSSWDKAHKLYGKKIPDIVEERLIRELSSIIKHGFAFLYITAKKLVEKSAECGYLVGSRGSVGSSFVATMCEISEVNPLQPHYVCPNCKNCEFIVDGSYGSGFDLPSKKCPNCQTEYLRDGQDIPFETFLGFDGDKIPDIDLNFSGECQADIHRYTEQLFGRDNVFKAGTISTIAQKMSLGFIKKYAEENNVSFSKTEENRLSIGCSGVRKTTGQHPGGMVVVPKGMEIYDFCPIQRPANDQKSDNITTHFDFHSIHDTICKLDELGHDIPSIYKYLEDFSGVKVESVPMSDRKVMSLLNSTEALNLIDENDPIDAEIGTISLPELGTQFVRQMLADAKPKTFSDLVQISGLSHGTGVWTSNARDLIKSSVCSISEVIGTRDNIMTFLRQKGIDSKTAFDIMEIVRRGKAKKLLTQEYKNLMLKKNVPQWYIDSCMKIEYIFPKAHASAYVIAALRLGWYKVYKPLEYYAAYFTVRGQEDMNALVVQGGRKALKRKMQDIRSKGKEASGKERNSYLTLQIVDEMLARGIEVLPVDLYKSHSKMYLIESGKIRFPFSSLPGVGGVAAENLELAKRHGKYISIEDVRNLANLSKDAVEMLKKAGALDDLPESSQMSLF